MNSTKTHLTIEDTGTKYIFTGTYDTCRVCYPIIEHTENKHFVNTIDGFIPIDDFPKHIVIDDISEISTVNHPKINIDEICIRCIPVICFGSDRNYNKWKYLCPKHFETGACKKQLCNNCNKKAAIRDTPKICIDCMTLILNNCVAMFDVCKYPDISRVECQCIYCKIS